MLKDKKISGKFLVFILVLVVIGSSIAVCMTLTGNTVSSNTTPNNDKLVSITATTLSASVSQAIQPKINVQSSPGSSSGGSNGYAYDPNSDTQYRLMMQQNQEFAMYQQNSPHF